MPEVLSQRLSDVLTSLSEISLLQRKSHIVESIQLLNVDIKRIRQIGIHLPQDTSVVLTFTQNRLAGILNGFNRSVISKTEFKALLQEIMQKLTALGVKKSVQKVVEVKPVVKTQTFEFLQGLKLFKENAEKVVEKETVTEYQKEEEQFLDNKYLSKRDRFPVSMEHMIRLIKVDVVPMDTFYSQQMNLSLKRIGVETYNIDDYKIFVDQNILLVNKYKWEETHGKLDVTKLCQYLDVLGKQLGKSLNLVSKNYRPCPKNGNIVCFWIDSAKKQTVLRKYVNWGFLFE